MQGMTAELGLVAHWTFPPRLDYDIKWLICYVILSRVPSLPQLMSIGLSDKIRDIIEGGPPDNLVQAFNTLFQDKAEQTLAAALEARRMLGWSSPHPPTAQRSKSHAFLIRTSHRRTATPLRQVFCKLPRVVHAKKDTPFLSASSPLPCDTGAAE